MKKIITTIIVIFVVFIGIVVAGPLFIINEGEQAVVVQLGRISNVITTAGLKLKVPFIDEVVRYPKKIMAWDGEARIIPTAERQFIFVDVVARWRIADPKKFYESIKTIDAAYSRLAEIIDSEVRTVVTRNPLIESVRNSDIIMDRSSGIEIEITEGSEEEVISTPMQVNYSHEPIKKGRRRLAEEILANSRGMVPEYGIELIDVVTRQISYSPELTPSVYARMKRERDQIAMYYRSQGEGKKAEWLGRMNNEKRSLLSAAYMEAEEIRGRADAEASRIYAEAYNRDRSFFDFWRAIESYRQTMPKFKKTLTTDMDYFRYLYSPRQ
ncbi:MAG: protease modulator HflC [Treponema sp.]|nr:protease modulator HflC [Treponema sp.]MCL2251461.1 protease modulator HflC [Treponema sp.]